MNTLLAVLEEARERGFLGTGPVSFHVEHARAYLPLLADVSGAALDLGTGGGVPGLVLALERPDLEWTFVDAMRKRSVFLVHAVEALGLRVAVRTARAEELRDLRRTQDAVVARSFGSPPVVAECAAPLLRVGGRLVVSEPPGAVDRWDGAGILGLGEPQRVPGPPSLVVLTQVAPCPSRFPRRSGIPTKRPLW